MISCNVLHDLTKHTHTHHYDFNTTFFDVKRRNWQMVDWLADCELWKRSKPQFRLHCCKSNILQIQQYTKIILKCETPALDWLLSHRGRVLEVPPVLEAACYIAALPFTQQKWLAIYGHVASLNAMYVCVIYNTIKDLL